MAEKITVGEAIADRDGVKDATDGIRALLSAVQADPTTHDMLQAVAAKYNRDKQPHDPIYALNHAMNHLIKYGQLLQSAIDETEMFWPPKLK